MFVSGVCLKSSISLVVVVYDFAGLQVECIGDLVIVAHILGTFFCSLRI